VSVQTRTAIAEVEREGPAKRIYVTHCSARKDDSLKGKGKVSPFALYTSSRIRAFMTRCIARKVQWAIFPDKYGLWFPHEMHEWYEKSPYEVTEPEFQALLAEFDRRLEDYAEIVFYVNLARLHSLYKRLLKETRLREKLRLVNHYWDVS
jgi:hypothetical protein